MKKLIVFSVVFALLATAVFAEVGVGAWGAGRATLFGGSSEEYSDITSSGNHELRAEFSGENDEGSFGGSFKIWAQEGPDSAFGWVWWKPIDQLKIQIGHNKWADFGVDDIVGWGFNAGANDGGVTVDNRLGIGMDSAHAQGWGAAGAAISLYPVDGFAINLGIPYEINGTLEDVYSKIFAQIRYDISGIGRVAIAFKSGKGYKEPVEPKSSKLVDYEGTDDEYGWKPKTFNTDGSVKEWEWAVVKPGVPAKPSEWVAVGGSGEVKDPAEVQFAFLLTAVENLTVNFGIGYKFPITTKAEVTYNNPLFIGLGVEFGAGDFGVKARLLTGLGASTVYKDYTINAPLVLGFDILPYYDLGIFKFFFNAGIAIVAEREEYDATEKKVKAVEDSSTFGFHVNPYIAKSVGSGTFFAGFKLYSDNVTTPKDVDPIINWSVPVGITFGF